MSELKPFKCAECEDCKSLEYNYGDLIDRATVKDFWLRADWDTGMDLGKEKNAFAVINSVPTIIPGEEVDNG